MECNALWTEKTENSMCAVQVISLNLLSRMFDDFDRNNCSSNDFENYTGFLGQIDTQEQFKSFEKFLSRTFMLWSSDTHDNNRPKRFTCQSACWVQTACFHAFVPGSKQILTRLL